LRTRTTRGAGARAEAHHGFGAAGRGYVDTAALFMVRTVTTLARGGVAAMILPRSLLAARDATEARRTAVASARLAEMWLPGPRVFDAAVDVCAPLFVA